MSALPYQQRLFLASTAFDIVIVVVGGAKDANLVVASSGGRIERSIAWRHWGTAAVPQLFVDLPRLCAKILKTISIRDSFSSFGDL